jgi:phosphatidylglycerophosphatase A
MKILIKLIASGFYAGYSPIAPGTLGSLWGVVLYFLFHRHASVFLSITAFLFVLGFLISERAEVIFNEKDSKKIVIDEMASMCLVYIFIKPEYIMLVSGFVLFRFFDIIKPVPARKIEKLSGAKAVMGDDLVAAVYTVLLLLTINSLQAAGILPVKYI